MHVTSASQQVDQEDWIENLSIITIIAKSAAKANWKETEGLQGEGGIVRGDMGVGENAPKREVKKMGSYI